MSFPVEGMTCAACVNRITRYLGDVEGVETATVNLATETASVRFDPDRVDLERLGAAVEAAGYQAVLPSAQPVEAAPEDETAPLRRRLIVSALLSVPVLLMAMIPPLQFDNFQWLSLNLVTPVVLWGRSDLELHPSPAEVAHAYRIGLAELCRPDSPRFVSIPESDRPVVQVPLGRDLIHAPTGAVLLQFRCVALDGNAGTRVDELEQPVFAWR